MRGETQRGAGRIADALVVAATVLTLGVLATFPRPEPGLDHRGIANVADARCADAGHACNAEHAKPSH